MPLLLIVPALLSIAGTGLSIAGGIRQNQALREQADANLKAQELDTQAAAYAAEADRLDAQRQARADALTAEQQAAQRAQTARNVTIAGMGLLLLSLFTLLLVNLKKR